MVGVAVVRPNVAWDRILLETDIEQDVISGFSSANDQLDAWWLDHSLTWSKNNLCATYVALSGDRPIGFFAVSPSSVFGGDMPKNRVMGKPRMIHPIWLLGQLAVSHDLQHDGVGVALLLHAVKLFSDLSKYGGGRFMAVDPISDEVSAWYRRFGFVSFKDGGRLYMPVRKARELVSEQSDGFFMFAP